MPLNLSGFVVPEQKFDGLDEISKNLENRRANEQKMAADKEERTRKEAATRLAYEKYFSSKLNPSNFLTGTNLDDNITKRVFKIKNDVSDMISSGIDESLISTIIAQDVANLAEYSSRAKIINKRIKDALSLIPNKSGYNKLKLEEAARRLAFYNDDGTEKDPSAVDTDANWVLEAITKRPYEVTTDEDLENWLNKQEKQKFYNTIYERDKSGRRKDSKVEVNAYSWAEPDIDEEGFNSRFLVPKYDKAIDEDEKEVYYEYIDKDSKKTGKVRLVDDLLYDQILNDSEATRHWLTGQIINASGGGVDKDGNKLDIKSGRGRIIGRAILYHTLKNKGLGTISDITRDDQPLPHKPSMTIINNQNKVTEANDVIDSYQTLPDGNKDVSTSLSNRKNSEYTTIRSAIFNPRNKTISINGGEFEPIKQARLRIEGVNPDTKLDIFDMMERYNTKGGVSGGRGSKDRGAGDGGIAGGGVNKNNASYYSDEKNVASRKGNIVTYKDGTVWEIKGGVLKLKK